MSKNESMKNTVKCSDCLSDVEIPGKTVAVLKCPTCDGLLPIDNQAAELIALGRLSQWVGLDN